MMARMAALSGTVSFPQALTTSARSAPSLCEAICEGRSLEGPSLLVLWRVRAPSLPPFHFRSSGVDVGLSSDRPAQFLQQVGREVAFKQRKHRLLFIPEVFIHRSEEL